MHKTPEKTKQHSITHCWVYIIVGISFLIAVKRVRNFHILFVEEETDDDGEKSAKKNLQMTHVLMRKKDENYVVLVN